MISIPKIPGAKAEETTTSPHSTASTPKVSDHFRDESTFQLTLQEAEENAQGSWAESFVSDITTRVTRHGFDAFMTEKQAEQLRRIAKGDSR